MFGPATVTACLYESYDRLVATATVHRYLVVLAERFTRDRLQAIAKAEGKTVTTVPEVLFVCVHNAGRSQMAAALLDHRAKGAVHVRSAGSDPAETLNPAVVEAMSELEADELLDGERPQVRELPRVIAIANQKGGVGKRYLDWELEDPAGKSLATVRRIRDDIDNRVQTLLAQLSATIRP